LAELEKEKSLLQVDVQDLTSQIKDLEAKEGVAETQFWGEKEEEAIVEDPKVVREKRLKALKKKLQQISKLKEKGEVTDPEAAAKLASEPKLLAEVAALERGEDFDPDEVIKQLPVDTDDVEKKIKALRKKLQQIDLLKTKKKDELDAEALAKIESERKILQEIAALERGDEEVVFLEEAETEEARQAREEAERVKIVEEKVEVEKKIRALKKKLTQIDKLKEGSKNLDGEAKEKMASEPALKKELHQLEAQVGNLNKQERNRVNDRMGWEDEAKKTKKKG